MSVATPYDHLDAAERLRWSARAYVSSLPDHAEDDVEHAHQRAAWRHRHGDDTGLWFRTVGRDGSSWYVRVKPDGQGESGPAPPDEPVAATFVAQGSTAVADWMAAEADRLDGGDERSRQAATDARAALGARQTPPYWFEQHWPPVVFATPDQPPNAGDAWHRAVDLLLAMRERRLVDGLFPGLMGAALSIIDGAAAHSPDAVAAYHRYLTCTGMALKPAAMIDDLVALAASDGLLDVCGIVADHLRDSADRLKQEALECPTLDRHLEQLYRAIPPAYGALHLYRALAAAAPADARGRFAAAHTAADELTVRLTTASVQVLGELSEGAPIWRHKRELVARARREGGSAAAERAARRIAKQELYFPYAVARVLAT